MSDILKNRRNGIKRKAIIIMVTVLQCAIGVSSVHALSGGGGALPASVPAAITPLAVTVPDSSAVATKNFSTVALGTGMALSAPANIVYDQRTTYHGLASSSGGANKLINYSVGDLSADAAPINMTAANSAK